ncbi:Protein argonaute 5 [Linum perenne]
MSRRGGGRRPDLGRDQQPSSPAQSSRGRGGRGRGRGGDAAPAPIVAQPNPQDPRPAQIPAAASQTPRPQAAGVWAPRPQSTGGQTPRPPVIVAAAQTPSPQATYAAQNPRPPVTAAAAQNPRPQATSAAQTPRPEGVVAAAQPAAVASSSQLAKEIQQKLVISGPAGESSKAIALPLRPGFGRAGMKCVVRANHFLVKVAANDIRHYDVSITPEITSKKVSRDVIKQLSDLYKTSHLGDRMMAYDGSKSLYTAGPLPFESKEFEIKLENENRANQATVSSSKRKERVFKVVIRFAAKPDIDHLRAFLAGRQRDVPSETIQALDVVLRHEPSLEYTVVGRSFCDKSLGNPGSLGDGVEYWRGYYQSLRPTQMGLSLNVDVSARSFYESVLVTEFLSRSLRIQDLNRQMSDQDRAKARKALRGVKVSLDNGEFRKSYKITGISPLPVNRTMFTLEGENKSISVAEYFSQRYKIRLRYPNLPALQAGTPPKIFHLPMERCTIASGQRYTKKLNERQVTALLRATCQRPEDREKSIKQIASTRGHFINTDIVGQFGIEVVTQPVQVDARVLPPPTLKYYGTGPNANVSPQMGAWNMINKKMVNGGRVDHWSCLNFSSLNRDFPFDFCDQLIQMCSSRGMQFNPNPLVPIRSERPQQLEKALRDVHYQATQQGRELQLLIIVLPDYTGSYGTIKRICETELGIVTQCVQPKQASKLSKQYLENLSLKVNVKVGGRNTVLNDAVMKRIPLLTDRPTIVFGADVTHAQPGEDSTPSIAAVVASMDWPEVTKYRGLVSAQASREEIIMDLYNTRPDPVKGIAHGGMIRELLISFKNSTGQKPERILFYRDGVSEGQFSQVLLHEVQAIRKACASLQEGYQPRITFIVVQKRHHTRLFPYDHNDRRWMDKSKNILPGTVVDTQICHPTEFDFYLNSHAGIQGTSRPAHYHVLYDENNFSPDGLQLLTNSLCYTYARCTRSVSIVPPAYYAHLAAFRARYYIEGTEDSNSSDEHGLTAMPRAIQPLPQIKANVKDVMFYC